MKTGIYTLIVGLVLAGVCIANVIGLSSGRGMGLTGVILPGIAGVIMVIYGVSKIKQPKASEQK